MKTFLYPNIETLQPQACISGKMMRCNRMVANVFRKHLKPFKVTDSQLSQLFAIAKGKNINQKKLSDILKMDKSSVNRNLKRLFEKSYIHYQNTKIVTLTKKGEMFLEKVIPAWNNAMEEIRSILSDDGEEALNILISKFK